MSPTNVIKLFSFFSKKIILFDKKYLLYLFFNLKILKTLKYTHLCKHRVQFNHVYSICRLKSGLARFFFWGGGGMPHCSNYPAERRRAWPMTRSSTLLGGHVRYTKSWARDNVFLSSRQRQCDNALVTRNNIIHTRALNPIYVQRCPALLTGST